LEEVLIEGQILSLRTYTIEQVYWSERNLKKGKNLQLKYRVLGKEEIILWLNQGEL
jgi:hypothetical protein